MIIPEGFEGAYKGLVELVKHISSTEVPKEVPKGVLGEKVDQWKHADCRGAATLAEAATKALRYELASRGLREGASSVEENLETLSRVETTLMPPPSTGSEKEDEEEGKEPEIVEVALPEQLREKMPSSAGRAFRMNDEFQILFDPGESNGPPHAHLSISHPRRYPSFEELQDAAWAPGGRPPNLWALVPGPDQQHSIASKTVHLYVLPPEELLGRGQG